MNGNGGYYVRFPRPNEIKPSCQCYYITHTLSLLQTHHRSMSMEYMYIIIRPIDTLVK
jgi:hypothetical protein